MGRSRFAAFAASRSSLAAPLPLTPSVYLMYLTLFLLPPANLPTFGYGAP